MEKTYLVLQSEKSEDNGGVWTAVTPFYDIEKAKSFVEHVIRDEWQTVVPYIHGSPLLADMKGFHCPSDGTIKHSEYYYSADGDEAWVNVYENEKTIKILIVGKEGERLC